MRLTSVKAKRFHGMRRPRFHRQSVDSQSRQSRGRPCAATHGNENSGEGIARARADLACGIHHFGPIGIGDLRFPYIYMYGLTASYMITGLQYRISETVSVNSSLRRSLIRRSLSSPRVISNFTRRNYCHWCSRGERRETHDHDRGRV